MGIKVDALSSAVMRELNAYSQVVNEDMKEIVKEVADDVKKDISATAPQNRGLYKKSWRVKPTRRSSTSINLTIHSERHYRLTHLLEFGHAKRGGGRTRAFPYIAQAEEKGIKELDKKIKEALHG